MFPREDTEAEGVIWLRFTAADGRCLTDNGYGLLHMSECDDGSGQRWKLVAPGVFHGTGDRCLVDDYGKPTTVGACEPFGAAASWSPETRPDGSVAYRNDFSGDCLVRQGHAVALGNCSDGPGWRLEPVE